MKKTLERPAENRLAVNTPTLAGMLCVGLDTARKIGLESGARVQIGKRVLYKVDRVERYLDELADGQEE